MELDPLSGPDVGLMVSDMMKTPAATVASLAAYVAPQD